MALPNASPEHKMLLLGTAMWGWSIDRLTAYQILENYLIQGGIVIDTALNYPINNKRNDYGLALKWISDWLKVNGTKELKVLVKIGAIDNTGGDEIELNPESIKKSEEYLREKLDNTLSAICIHWDNRGDNNNDIKMIADTIKAMIQLQMQGLSIGFSGVKRPDLYLNFSHQYSEEWWIQVKENAATNSARLKYEKYFPKSKYLVYGINMGGVKLEPPNEKSSLTLRGIKYNQSIVKQLSSYLENNNYNNCPPTNLNELALLQSYFNEKICGIIIGPRTIDQLNNSLYYWNNLLSNPTAL